MLENVQDLDSESLDLSSDSIAKKFYEIGIIFPFLTLQTY